MTAARVAVPPGWFAFTIRATILSVLVFGAAAYPFHAWEGDDGLLVLALGGGLELVLISISYAVLKASFSRSRALQYYAMLAGLIVRFGPTIAAVFALWYLTDLPRMAVVVSLVGFYVVFLFYEAKVCWPSGS
jgi:hypothetical protein